MRLGPAQLVVQTVCVHNHSGIFEQPQTVTTTPMSGHELNTHSSYISIVAGHRMGYHEHAPGAYYGLKYRASQKRYLVIVLGLQLLQREHDASTDTGRLGPTSIYMRWTRST
jgi:hypothetical protein